MVQYSPTGFLAGANLVQRPAMSPLQAMATKQAMESQQLQDVRQSTEFAQKQQARRAAQLSAAQLSMLGTKAVEAWRANDKETFQETLMAISQTDPEKARQLNIMFGSLDRSNFVQGAHNLVAASVSKNPEAADKLLDQAIELTSIRNPNHPFIPGLKDLRSMPHEDRAEGYIAAIELAKRLGAFGDPAQGMTAQQKADVEAEKNIQGKVDKLREAYKSQSRSFRDVTRAYNRIKSVGSTGTAASDLALVFNFMKMQDPESVVRESEFKTAANARAHLTRLEEEGKIVIPANVKIWLGKLDPEGKAPSLTETQRKDFVQTAKDLYVSAQTSNDVILKEIYEYADVDNVPRNRVFGMDKLSQWHKRQSETIEETTLGPAAGQPTEAAPGSARSGPGAPNGQPHRVPRGAEILENPGTGQEIYWDETQGTWRDANTGEAVNL